MKRRLKKQRGQAIVEYIIIIVIVAVAALTVMGIFSDRIRTIIAGVASTFGAEGAEEAVETPSVQILQEIDASGLELETSE
jgi:Flp pilus assembly pilin Flp